MQAIVLASRSRTGHSARVPFTIRLQEYSGATVDEIQDDGTLTRLLRDFHDKDSAVIKFLDPYDDTMLNSLQMEVLMIELAQKAETLTSPDERAVVQRLIDLADQGASGRPRQVHRQLWFIGD